MDPQGHNPKNGTNIWMFTLEIGLFGGLIWGGIKGVFYFMRITTVVPGFMVEPFFKSNFLKSQPGYYVGWGAFIVFSLLATLIYVLLFRKFSGPVPGILYGIAWWVILFVLAGPALHLMEPLRKLSMNTIISEFCLYLLWGLFVGYSTAHEYTDERKREPQEMSDKPQKNPLKKPTENPQH